MFIDFNKFKMLEYAYYCGNKGKLYPAFYNHSNELLVELFLDQKISFLDIEIIMEKSLTKFDNLDISKYELSYDNLDLIDKESEKILFEIIKEL